MNIQDLKLNNELNKEGLDVAKQLSGEYLYRNLAYALFAIFFVAAFFISLANAKFDLYKILEAQFWIDFAITFGGGMVLKWAFGKYGNFEGHKNEAVINELKAIEIVNKQIEDTNLLKTLTGYVEFQNNLRKVKAIRKKVFIKLNNGFIFKSKWQKQKRAVQIAEQYLLAEDDTEVKEELKQQLDDLNFDLESYKIKYPFISESTLKTGFNAKEDDDDKLSFNEYYELFGRNSLVTLLSVIMTVLLAASSIVINDLSLTTFFIFFTRITMFGINSYVGFVVAKAAVETTKLNILVKINKFLRTFFQENITKTKQLGGES